MTKIIETYSIDYCDIVFNKKPWQNLERVEIFTNLNLK